MIKKIAIHSVPRSGSTWLGNIFNSHPDVNFSLQPLFSYAFKDFLNENSTKKEISEFFDQIALSDDDFIRQKEGIKKGIIPDFKKSKKYTHICYKAVRHHHILSNLLAKDSEIKIIGLIRNPFATIYSWLKAPKEFRGDLGWKIEEEWNYAPSKNLDKPEEFNGYQKWKEVAALFLDLKRLYPSQFFLLNYDDLLIDTNTCIRELFEFCELNMSEQTINFINPEKKVEQQDAYSVFKHKTNDNNWVGKLPSFIIDEITKDKDFIILNHKFNWIQ